MFISGCNTLVYLQELLYSTVNLGYKNKTDFTCWGWGSIRSQSRYSAYTLYTNKTSESSVVTTRIRVVFSNTTVNGWTFLKTHVDQLLLLLLRHLPEAVIASSQVVLQPTQGLHNHVLHFPSLSPRAGRWEAQSTDAAAGADTGWKDVVVIKNAVGYLEEFNSEKWSDVRTVLRETVERERRCFPGLTLEASRSVGCFMVLGS